MGLPEGRCPKCLVCNFQKPQARLASGSYPFQGFVKAVVCPYPWMAHVIGKSLINGLLAGHPGMGVLPRPPPGAKVGWPPRPVGRRPVPRRRCQRVDARGKKKWPSFDSDAGSRLKWKYGLSMAARHANLPRRRSPSVQRSDDQRADRTAPHASAGLTDLPTGATIRQPRNPRFFCFFRPLTIAPVIRYQPPVCW